MAAVDEAFINGVYAGLTFHSLLKQEQMPPPLLFLEPSLNYNPNGFPETENQDLKIPKTEQQLFNVNSSISGEVSDHYNFFSNMTSTVAGSDVVFTQLPGLLSLELPQYKNSQHCTSSPSYSVEPAASALDSERKSYHQHRLCQYKSPGAVSPSSTVARQRRQRISDKTKSLQKLLPWDKRMDMTTMLEETYKYIKFLQAQISILQSMPSNCVAVLAGNDENGSVLGRLNRQQLLEVLVNSPVAQTVLYSKGCCIYSVEQLVMLKNNAETNAFFHNMHGI